MAVELKSNIRLFLLLLITCGALVQSYDRHFILIFDAGSTGTRLNVFEFLMDTNHSTGLRIISLKDSKISPGLSNYATAPGRLREVMRPLMEFANASVPGPFQGKTTAVVRATAGLRAVPEIQLRGIVRVVAEVLRRSNFLVPNVDSRAVRVISGREEAEYGWVAVNYLLDAFDQPGGDTFGMLDLGGGSTQITFVPKVDDTSDANRVEFRTMRGRTYALHEHSYLGLGLSQASLYMFGYNESQRPIYTSPCLLPPKIRRFEFGEVRIDVTGDPNVTNIDRYKRCSEVAQLPFRIVPVHQPPGIKVGKFVAVSSYFYTARMLNQLGFLQNSIPGNVTLNELENATVRVCERPPSSGKFEPYLCMSSLFVMTLLRDGYRFSGSQSLYITDKINGYSASWPLGLAIHRLTCHDGSGNVCLGSSSSTGPRNSAAVVISAATAIIMLLSFRLHF